MKRIASPVTHLKDSYEVVVIGSGYGGSIAASRLSRAGREVCLLERGEELLPGEYPHNLITAQKDFQIRTDSKHIGPKTGMFDLHVHDGISILVGCGLGGTSLINANVSIKPEPRIFEDERWPKIIREEFADNDSMLHHSYQLAETMLRPAPLPAEVKTKKLDALEFAANATGEKMYRTRVNVNFDIDGKNHVGVDQVPCNNCGDCCSGCNYGSKNTLLMNYLPDAKNHGAEIFCGTQVNYIAKDEEGYRVYFSLIGKGTEKFKAPNEYIRAKKVVVSAGTLGSSEIMLRSKERGLPVSDQVGNRFSGNGDVLGFGYNTNRKVNGVGAGNTKRFKKDPVGPCITGVIDAREKENLDDGMIIEDAAIPSPLAKILSSSMAALDLMIGDELGQKRSLKDRIKRIFRKLDSLIRGAYAGAMLNTQTFLVMSTDTAKGEMRLKNDKLQLKFPGVGAQPIYQLVDEKLKAATKASEGDYIKDPIWTKQLGNELITVHPLGGCSMGNDFSDGVVNHKGQVFDTEGVHEGLYVLDGSILPRAVGVNPLYTISALAERACSLMAQENRWHIGYAFDQKGENVGVETKVGIEFTETMKGFFSDKVTNGDFEKAAEEGKKWDKAFQFTLTILSDDVYDMISNSKHEAKMIGTVTAPSLSREPLSVLNGTFNLFVDDPNNVATKLMKYTMVLNSVEGKSYYFYGYKIVNNKKNSLDLWPDTSTLYITIHDGATSDSPVLGQGILKIKTRDFAKQMTTMKAVNASSKKEALKAVADFGKFFSTSLFDVYGRAFVPDKFYDPDKPPRVKRPLRIPEPKVYPLKTKDGEDLILTRYKGGEDKLPLLMLHGFSGNQYTFNIDTIDTNAAEYFYEHGYDVWILDYRLSSLVKAANQQHTLDEIVDNDLPDAVAKILQITGKSQIDVLAHCVGSITMFMALLSGLKGVRSLVSAQIAIDFHPTIQVGAKTGLHLPKVLDDMGIKTLTAFSSKNENWREKLYDHFIKLYADHTQEFCTDPSCQRMCFMFGPLVEHKQLNDATHSATIEMFGTANLESFEHLALMIRKNKVLRADGADTYIGGIDNLNIPITFIAGENNGLFQVKSTYSTYESLVNRFGNKQYKHHTIKGYGHNDCMYGKNASKDVFPLVLEHFESFY